MYGAEAPALLHYLAAMRCTPTSLCEQAYCAQGRPLLVGDLLPVTCALPNAKEGLICPEEWVPQYPSGDAAWEVGVLPGPNAAPDYFTQGAIDTLYSATYTVHYNS